MGENNTQTARKGCGVKTHQIQVLKLQLIDSVAQKMASVGNFMGQVLTSKDKLHAQISVGYSGHFIY